MKTKLYLLVLLTLFVARSYGQSPKSAYKVVVFLGHECPISQKYSLVLNNIYLQFADDIKLEGVMSVIGISDKEIQEFSRYYDIQFPLVRDSDLEIARQFHATITPEVFLMDDKGSILYSGSIDNWYYELGKHRKKATVHFLEDALMSVLHNQPISMKKTKAVGCFINNKMMNHGEH